jgi:hypothetical protein
MGVGKWRGVWAGAGGKSLALRSSAGVLAQRRRFSQLGELRSRGIEGELEPAKANSKCGCKLMVCLHPVRISEYPQAGT